MMFVSLNATSREISSSNGSCGSSITRSRQSLTVLLRAAFPTTTRYAPQLLRRLHHSTRTQQQVSRSGGGGGFWEACAAAQQVSQCIFKGMSFICPEIGTNSACAGLGRVPQRRKPERLFSKASKRVCVDGARRGCGGGEQGESLLPPQVSSFLMNNSSQQSQLTWQTQSESKCR